LWWLKGLFEKHREANRKGWVYTSLLETQEIKKGEKKKIK